MQTVAIHSAPEFAQYRNPVAKERLDYENKLAEQLQGKEQIIAHYFCSCCDKIMPMTLDWKYSADKITPVFRERLRCMGCQLNVRQRFVIDMVKELAPGSTVYFYEQRGFLFEQVLRYFPDAVGSEFLGYDKKSGDVVDGYLHQDAMDMSFADNTFDFVMSSDVFEHIPDIHRGLAEMHRIMKPGGKALISIPFAFTPNTTMRAELQKDGQIRHLLPPVYHGNPMDAKGGSLVFYDYGWDFLGFCRDAGFKDAYMIAYYDIDRGYIGNAVCRAFMVEK